jgi:hypothetical protein
MPALASEQPNVSRDALMDIARKFVTRVGGKLDQLKAEENAGKSAKPGELTMIPDGQMLLFVPKIEKYRFDSDIAGIKDKGTIYLSIEDFINTFDLPIEYDPERQRALGWYLREDWPLSIDIKQKTVFFRDKKIAISDQDVLVEDNEVYIDNKVLGAWLDTDFKLDVAQLYIGVDTPYPIPSIAKLEREKRNKLGNAANVAQLPRKEIEYDWLDINTADIRFQERFRKRESGNSTTDSNSVAIEGQLLKHQMYALASNDRENGINSVTGRLSKRNEDPVLLGPLKARSYVIGDTDTVSIPLTGGASPEMGMRVSNNTLGSLNFQKTDITGDALPGWDVELYRDGGRIDTIRVGDDGHYEFVDTQLYAGDNMFELFFYGPQGEIRSEAFNVPVTADMLATQKNTYDVSISFAETQLYQQVESDSERKGSPHIAARYSTFVGDALVYGGFRHRTEEDAEKTYAATGFTTIKGGAVLEGNLAVDERLETAAQINVQKNFINDWRTAGSVLVQTDKFGLDDDESPNDRYVVSGSVTKNFDPLFLGDIGTFSLADNYSSQTDGASINRLDFSLSDQIGRFDLTNSVIYNTRTGGSETIVTEDQAEQLFDTISARTDWGDYFARGGATYQFKPENQVDEYFGQFSYRPSKTLLTDLTASHVPEQKLSEARLTMTYVHDKFRASPYVDVNSDHDVEAGVSVNFSAIKKPSEVVPELTSRRLIGRGMVSSFVYFDKNGNSIYDYGDEPLPDVVVESLNIKRRESTDSKGYSLIRDLPDTYATDIHVDNSTLPDPFMISGFEGVSIFPNAGEIVELQFPVHMSGVIDGTVRLTEAGQVIDTARAGLQLIPIDGKAKKTIEADAAEDGYYELNQIPPGTYLMMISNSSARRLKAAAPAPGIVKIGYEGTTLSGVDINLKKGQVNVPVKTQMVVSGVPANAPMPTLKIRQGGKTELLSVLRKLALTRASGRLFSGLEPIAPVGDKEEQVSYYKFADHDIAKTHQRCQQMVNQGVSCEMVIFIRQKDAKPFKTALKS